jgi:hypothetical protein
VITAAECAQASRRAGNRTGHCRDRLDIAGR